MTQSPPTFSPRILPEPALAPVAAPDTAKATSMMFGVQLLLGLIITLIPWWVWLAPAVSIGFAKVAFVAVGMSIVAIVVALLALRTRSVSGVLPLPLIAWWGFVLLATCSALLSADVQAGLSGLFFEVHTVGFVVLSGVLMTAMLLFQQSLRALRWLLVSIAGSYILLFGWHVIRAFSGGWLSFGWFADPLSSPLGTFNDLAVLCGFIAVATLVYFLGSVRTVVVDGLAFAGLVVAMLLLLVINFSAIWMIVGLFALLVLLYMLGRDTMFASGEQSSTLVRPQYVMLAAALVCAMAALHFTFGDAVQQRMSQLTGISYLEVRPTPAATLSVLQSVYQEQAFLGIGPNRFDAAWRLYRNPSIMTTSFWNTEFAAGSGYIPTWFVTTGLFGGGLLVVFFGLWLYFGYRTFLRAQSTDSEWYQYGVMSFAGASFMWIISTIYTPGVAVLLLTAVATGVAFAVAGALRPRDHITVRLAYDRRSGFLVMAAVLVVLLGALGTIRFVTNEFAAHRAFAAIQTDPTLTLEAAVASLDTILVTREYAPALETAARVQLVILNQLLAQPEPTDEDRRRFEAAAIRAVQLAERAVARTDANPSLHALRGGVYATLARAGIPEATEQVSVSLDRAEVLDPRNPQYPFLRAQLAIQAGDGEAARVHIISALERKPNYSEALLLLSQLEIELGNTAQALAATQALVSFEPQNPTRHFQLGVLLAAVEEPAAAVQALSTAIALDQSYANARYIRALVQIEQGNTAAGLEDLERVAADNPDNAELQQLLTDVRSGQTDRVPTISTVTPVSDQAAGSPESNVVVGESPDSNLVSPINLVPGSTADDITQGEEASSDVIEEVTEESVVTAPVDEQ